ncbi:CapA family protein [Pseudoalteromonas lipolytica]|uniref:CapA family protein n=1 Tax=Pseudoalteromonas lipolytica TaxID=570156 RepID=A0AAD0WDV7_9GAMM|nr:CapA family protein [Pseudoalteromonas donghaensis]AXV66456.1 CapA family protein [Pseudoalteromonas donghaensis]
MQISKDSLIFVGDVSLSGQKGIRLTAPSWFLDMPIIVNLEGALVTDTRKYLSDKLVVNSFKCIDSYYKNLDVSFNLANNHILDNKDISETLNNLKKLRKPYFGAGECLEDASKPLIMNELIVLTFGWSVIECPSASKRKPGVNPLKETHVKSELLKYKQQFPNKKVVILFHWDYELEKYPMPSQRRLAFELIDLGCDLIVGAHPHRVQGYEIYKGKPIIYSIGNWLFEQNVFVNGKLKFPDFCNLQLAFEYSLSGDHMCHFFENDTETSEVKYLFSEPLDSSVTLNELSPFKGMSFSDYDNFFKRERHHKKLIPVYFSNNNKYSILFKNAFNYFRTLGINWLVRVGLK